MTSVVLLWHALYESINITWYASIQRSTWSKEGKLWRDCRYLLALQSSENIFCQYIHCTCLNTNPFREEVTDDDVNLSPFHHRFVYNRTDWKSYKKKYQRSEAISSNAVMYLVFRQTDIFHWEERISTRARSLIPNGRYWCLYRMGDATVYLCLSTTSLTRNEAWSKVPSDLHTVSRSVSFILKQL